MSRQGSRCQRTSAAYGADFCERLLGRGGVFFCVVVAFTVGIASRVVADEFTPVKATEVTPPTNNSLQVTWDRESSICNPEETLSFTIAINELRSHCSASVALKHILRRASDHEVLETETRDIVLDETGSATSITVTVNAPEQPGVYEFRGMLEMQDESVWSKFRRRSEVIVESGRPFIVRADASSRSTIKEAQPASAETSWRVIGTIRPAESRQWTITGFVPATTGAILSTIQPQSSSTLETTEHNGESISSLAPSTSCEFKLPVLRPSLPHVISVRYPTGTSAKYRVDVISSDATPLHSLAFSGESVHIDDQPWATRSFVYYPCEGEQTIRLTNLDATAVAKFHSIQVTAGPQRLSVGQVDLSPDPSTVALSLNNSDWASQLTSDFHSKGAVQSLLPETQSVFRLSTATSRLADYATACGMNAVIVPAGESLVATKSNLEIVMNLLDSSGLRVLVSLDFGKVKSLAMLPVSSETSTQPVDVAVLSLVRELSDICSKHACFAGFSVCNLGDEHWGPSEGSAPKGAESLDQQRRLWDRVASECDSNFLLRLRSSSVNLTGEDGFCNVHWPPKTSQIVPMIEHRRATLGSLSQRLAASRHLNSLSSHEPVHDRPIAVALSELSVVAGDASATLFDDSLCLDLSRVIDRVHPQFVVFDFDTVTGSVSPNLSTMIRSLASASIGRMQPVTPRDPSTPPMRLYQDPTTGSILAVNIAPWASEIDITSDPQVSWSSPASFGVLSFDAFGAPLATAPIDSAQPRSVRLAAGETRYFTSSVTARKVSDWTSRPTAGEVGLGRIKSAVTLLVERLGSFSELPDYPALANGGFEQSSSVGIVGWMGAQHPPDAVQIDTEAVEGKQSVRLTTDPHSTTHTWLVSETIEVPASGRLAVALAYRGELSPQSADQSPTFERKAARMRIAIEGRHRGAPVRYAIEVDVPRDGCWQPRRVLLEIDALEPAETESLRLTIDNLTGGKIWVDDVHLHDRFPLENERNELQGQSFLAVQGLQRGNLAPSARAIRNDWARHLLSIEPPPTLSSEHNLKRTEEPVPGVADRIRGWLPRPLRF